MNQTRAPSNPIGVRLKSHGIPKQDPNSVLFGGTLFSGNGLKWILGRLTALKLDKLDNVLKNSLALKYMCQTWAIHSSASSSFLKKGNEQTKELLKRFSQWYFKGLALEIRGRKGEFLTWAQEMLIF